MMWSRRPKAVVVLVAAAVLAACSDTSGPAASERQKGVLQLADYNGPAPATFASGDREVGWSLPPQHGDIAPPQVIVAPERVRAGEAFKVTTYTIGGGCTAADGQDTNISGNVVLLTPYDREMGEICTMQLVYVAHESTITLNTTGEWILRVAGRKIRFGDSTWEQAISAEIRVLVE